MRQSFKNKFFIILIASAFIITLSLFLFLRTNDKQADKIKNSTNDVEFTRNILLNASFEYPDFIHWHKANDFFPNIILSYSSEEQKDGRSSFFISSNEMFFDRGEPVSIFIYQQIENVPLDKKLIFNSYIKTENADGAFISIELYDKNDSLLTVTNTDLIEGTTDWTHYTTWIRTQNENIKYLLIKCALEGKGKAWFDKLELYPIDAAPKYFFAPDKEN